MESHKCQRLTYNPSAVLPLVVFAVVPKLLIAGGGSPVETLLLVVSPGVAQSGSPYGGMVVYRIYSVMNANEECRWDCCGGCRHDLDATIFEWECHSYKTRDSARHGVSFPTTTPFVVCCDIDSNKLFHPNPFGFDCV